MSTTERIQRDYYARTAPAYAAMHMNDGDEHFRALGEMVVYLRRLRAKTVLDVGSGTGRAVNYLTDHGFEVIGLEPVTELIAESAEQSRMVAGRGEQLPFRDSSMDAVCALGVLHHVSHPGIVVREMTRVARWAVFISDSNRFGHGSFRARVAKLALYQTGLWGLANFVKTKGRGYSLSENDGLAYSYSVFDNFPELYEWTNNIQLFTTDKASTSATWFNPLLTSHHVLVAAIRAEIA